MPANLKITEEEIDEILPLNNTSNITKNKSVKRLLSTGICLNEKECKEKTMQINKVSEAEFNQIINAFVKFLEIQNEIVDYDKVSEEDNIFINGFGRFKYRMKSIAENNLEGKLSKRGKKL